MCAPRIAVPCFFGTENLEIWTKIPRLRRPLCDSPSVHVVGKSNDDWNIIFLRHVFGFGSTLCPILCYTHAYMYAYICNAINPLAQYCCTALATSGLRSQSFERSILHRPRFSPSGLNYRRTLECYGCLSRRTQGLPLELRGGTPTGTLSYCDYLDQFCR